MMFCCSYPNLRFIPVACSKKPIVLEPVNVAIVMPRLNRIAVFVFVPCDCRRAITHIGKVIRGAAARGDVARFGAGAGFRPMVRIGIAIAAVTERTEVAGLETHFTAMFSFIEVAPGSGNSRTRVRLQQGSDE